MASTADASERWFAGSGLVDHHCHGVVEQDLERVDFERMITESNWDAPAGETVFDSQVGFAIRRWCAPVLDLDPHASPEAYLARRTELGAEEVNRRLLSRSGIQHFVVETGFRADEILDPAQMADRGNGVSNSVVRLEALAEQLIAEMAGAMATEEYAERFRTLLRTELRAAIGVKCIAAYRIGLDFEPSRPSEDEVRAAVERWISRLAEQEGPPRLDCPVLIRFGLWCAVDEAAPIQFHVGYGDPDVELHRCNPLLMSDWLHATRESGAKVLLLHCYPYHREAGFLSHGFPHVYMDVGLAINYTGARSREIIGESLELAPFSRLLFSSDAWGLSELYYLGAVLFKRGVGSWLDEWVGNGEWSVEDAERVVRMISGENFARAYGLTASRGTTEAMS